MHVIHLINHSSGSATENALVCVQKTIIAELDPFFMFIGSGIVLSQVKSNEILLLGSNLDLSSAQKQSFSTLHFPLMGVRLSRASLGCPLLVILTILYKFTTHLYYECCTTTSSQTRILFCSHSISETCNYQHMLSLTNQNSYKVCYISQLDISDRHFPYLFTTIFSTSTAHETHTYVDSITQACKLQTTIELIKHLENP